MSIFFFVLFFLFFDFFFGRREKSRTFMALNLDPAETKRSGERERDKWPSPIKRTVERPFRCPNGRYTARKGRERIIRNGPQNTREGTKPWHWYKEKTAREQHVDIRASKRREGQPKKKTRISSYLPSSFLKRMRFSSFFFILWVAIKLSWLWCLTC